jgi:hypothetical protein
MPYQRSSSGPSRFTNIQKYFEANKPTDKSKSIGGVISAEGQKKAESAQQQLKTASSSTAAAQQAGAASDLKLASSPDKIASIETPALNKDIEEIGKGLQAQFKGPTSLQDQEALAAKNEQLRQMGEATKSQAGRKSLLEKQFGSSNYTTGAKGLDLATMQHDTEQLAKVKALRKLGGQFGAQLGQAEQQAVGTAAVETQKAAKIREQAEGSRAEYSSKIKDTLQKLVDKYRGEEAVRASAAKSTVGLNANDPRLQQAQTVLAGTGLGALRTAKQWAKNPVTGKYEWTTPTTVVDPYELISAGGSYTKGGNADISNIEATMGVAPTQAKLGALNQLLELGKQSKIQEGEAATKGIYGLTPEVQEKVRAVAPQIKTIQQDVDFLSDENRLKNAVLNIGKKDNVDGPKLSALIGADAYQSAVQRRNSNVSIGGKPAWVSDIMSAARKKQASLNTEQKQVLNNALYGTPTGGIKLFG